MASDNERNKQTLIKPPEIDPADEATAAPMESPFAKTEHKDPVIGTHVSGYLVKGRLGSGGMGIVYEGEQQTIGKRVAIKVLRPEVAENPDVVQRLVAEARAVNSVGHRGIIDVFAFGELPDGRQCIVMEYLDGESLDAILNMYIKEQRPMPTGDVLIILDEILSALSAAHAAGVIHRDLKPSNIFLCRQRDGARYVKLLDFGIAKLGVLGNATPQSRASLMMGTPSYMAPEQAKGGNIGPAMDLYAVGVMAFEMFTGRLPFLADSVVAMLMAHQGETPPAPSSVNLTLPDGIDDMVGRLLAKKPEDRIQTAEETRQLVVKLRKELADPTSKRMQLEVTISPRDRAAAVASTALKASRPVPPPPPAATMAPLPPAVVPLATQQTAIAAKPKVAQQPEQVAPTQEDLGPAVAAADDALDALPRSNRGPVIGLAAVVVLLLGGVYALTRNPTPSVEPEPVAKLLPPPEPLKPPEPIVIAKVDPPPVAKVEAPPEAAPPPEPAKVEPEPVPVAKVEPAAVPVAKVEPAAVPVAKVEPAAVPVAKVEPAVVPLAKVEPVKVAKVEPVKVAKVEPTAVKAPKGSNLAARLKRLETRLEKATAAGNSVELYSKQVKKIQERLAEPGLTDDDRDRLESAVARLEQSTDF